MRICGKCREEKKEKEFSFRDKYKEILNSYCKECQSLYTKEHYSKNKKSYIERAKINSEKYKKEVINFVNSLKVKCKFCDEKHIACLEFHHRNSDEKEIMISIAIYQNGWSLNRLKKEIEKCDVLFTNCHKKIHWKEKQA